MTFIKLTFNINIIKNVSIFKIMINFCLILILNILPKQLLLKYFDYQVTQLFQLTLATPKSLVHNCNNY